MISNLLRGFNQILVDTFDLSSGFFHILIKPIKPTSQEQLVAFNVIPYWISNAPPAILNTITILRDEPGQFDELNSQYFADDYYITLPLFIHQEL